MTVLNNAAVSHRISTFTCCFPIARQLNDHLFSIPIGKPIGNTQVFILDRYLNPVPIGVAGELHIGGDGLARGYLNRPELTQEKFIANPFNADTDSRLYKTGDRARYLPDGNIEFLGRLDHQVKLRGYRIELGEIESVLGQHPDVQSSVDMLREDRPGDKRLVAFVVARPQSSFDAEELRKYLKQKLPEYMIPSILVRLDELPVTQNGKIDRSLLQTGPIGLVSNPVLVSPRTPTEAELAQIWSEVLNTSSPSVHDNFFDLGGHSLLAIRLLARIKTELDIDFPVSQFFEGPTISSMARQIEAVHDLARESKWSHLFKLKNGKDDHRPVFVFPGGFGGENEAMVLAQVAHFVGREYPFYGLRARSSQGDQRPHQSVEAMVQDFVREMRELQPEGPYYLVGHCLGGVVAYEAACQLEEENERVALLVFLDTVRPSRERYFRFRGWRVLEKLIPNWKFYYRDRIRYHVSRMRQLNWRERVEYLSSRLVTIPEVFDLLPGDASENARSAPKLRQLRDNQSGHIATLLRYRPRCYHGRIHSIVADEMPIDRTDPTLGWSRYAAGGVTVHKAKGDHDSFLRDYTRDVGDLLRSWIKEAETDSTKNGAGGGT